MPVCHLVYDATLWHFEGSLPWLDIYRYLWIFTDICRELFAVAAAIALYEAAAQRVANALGPSESTKAKLLAAISTANQPHTQPATAVYLR